MTVFELLSTESREPDGEPLHYTACGLDDIYLVNGFTRETIDGEDFITVEDLDGLWKAIGLHLVSERKVLAPKEIKFLREHMGFTQAQMGAHLRVTDQTVARWEKGETKCVPGPADFMLRVLFLACDRAQPEGKQILEGLTALSAKIVARDEVKTRPVMFRHGKRKWREETAKQLELA